MRVTPKQALQLFLMVKDSVDFEEASGKAVFTEERIELLQEILDQQDDELPDMPQPAPMPYYVPPSPPYQTPRTYLGANYY